MPAAKFWDGTTWQTIAAVQGPAGPQGPQGLQGIQGLQGPAGGNATVPLDPWHVVGAAGEPAYGANWSSYLGTAPQYAPVAFRKDPLGVVQLRGVLLSAVAQTVNAGTTAFTLPVGYRPVYRTLFDTTETIGQKTLVIYPDGTVTSAIAMTAGNGLLLDGLSFDTDTVTAMPTGPAGPPGAAGATSPPSGAAGGDLAGTYPNPTLSAQGLGKSIVTSGITGIQALVIPNTTVAFNANDGSGNSTGTLTLPGGAWPTAQVGFTLGYMWPLGHWNFYMKLIATSDKSHVTFQMNNAGGAQSFSIGGVSFGY